MICPIYFTGSVSILKLLLDNGADINVVNTKNNSALILAIGKSFEKAAELLIERGADVNIVGQNSETALTWAVDKNFEKIVQSLADKGADINHKNKYGVPAIIFAALNGSKITEI